MSDPKSTDPMVAALLRERAQLVQRGLDDRVRQVDDQLALRGYEAPETGDGEEGAPKGRRAPTKRTAANAQE